LPYSKSRRKVETEAHNHPFLLAPTLKGGKKADMDIYHVPFKTLSCFLFSL